MQRMFGSLFWMPLLATARELLKFQCSVNSCGNARSRRRLAAAWCLARTVAIRGRTVGDQNRDRCGTSQCSSTWTRIPAASGG